MRIKLIAMCLGMVASGMWSSAYSSDTSPHAVSDYTLYLVRHAEKVADDSKDPDLTTAGKARAVNLANRLQDKGIEDIWSSDYQRTRETAAPLANELDIKVQIYNPKEQSELVAQLKMLQHNALVTGHSNTIPELAGMLCGCAVKEMEETEYDRLIIIRMRDGEAELQTLSQ